MQDKLKTNFKNLMLVVLGSLLLSFAVSFFYLPNSIVTGGVSGLAIVLDHVINVDVAFLNEELYIFVLTWLFFVIGIFTLGKRFSLQTLCSTIVYPIGVYFFSFIFERATLFHLEPEPVNFLLAAFFGGALTGLGIGITFLGGGSTGGVDIPTLIIYKYFKVRVGISSFIIDTSIIILGVFVIQKYDLALIGIIAAFLAAFTMDKVFVGKVSYMAYIVSRKYDEINNFILEKLERGTTLLVSQGGYSKKDVKVIQVCFDVKEYHTLKQAIDAIDPHAFVSIVKAHEIRGFGFTYNEEFNEWLNEKKDIENE